MSAELAQSYRIAVYHPLTCMLLAATDASLLFDNLMNAIQSAPLLFSVLGGCLGLNAARHRILLAVTSSKAYLLFDSLRIVAICIAHSYRMTGNYLFVSVCVAMKEN